MNAAGCTRRCGFEFRLKGEDRLKEKIAEKLRVQPDREAAEIIREIPDATRYTFCLRPETYTAGQRDIKQRLEERGYEMYYSRNWWTNPEYKGADFRRRAYRAEVIPARDIFWDRDPRQRAEHPHLRKEGFLDA